MPMTASTLQCLHWIAEVVRSVRVPTRSVSAARTVLMAMWRRARVHVDSAILMKKGSTWSGGAAQIAVKISLFRIA